MSQGDGYWKPQRNVLIKGGGKRPHLVPLPPPWAVTMRSARRPAGPLAQPGSSHACCPGRGVLRPRGDSETPAHPLHGANTGHGIAR